MCCLGCHSIDIEVSSAFKRCFSYVKTSSAGKAHWPHGMGAWQLVKIRARILAKMAINSNQATKGKPFDSRTELLREQRGKYCQW